MLRVASLVTLLLMIIHLSQDVIFQPEGHVLYPIPVVIFAVWLYATLMLSDRILGLIILFFGGLIGAGMIVIHSRTGVVHQSGGLFFVWTMFAVATTGWVTAALAFQELWMMLRRGGRERLGGHPTDS
jgi:hypothetical protein